MSQSFHPSTYMSPNTVSSSCISNGEIYTESPSSTSPEICSPEVQALHILSQNINALLSLSDFDCSDAQITVEERVVPVHRCILGARSPYFRRLFSATSGREPLPKFKYELGELLREWKVGYEVFMVVLGYMYSGKIKEPPARVCTCVDATCSHDACRPAIDFALELLYCSYVFQIPELVSLSQEKVATPLKKSATAGKKRHDISRERHDAWKKAQRMTKRHMLSVVEKAQVEDVIPILAVANACQTGNDQLLSKCIEIVSRSDLDSTALEKGIPQQVAIEIFDIRSKLGLGSPDINSLQNKNVKRIQRALESDDVELVRMLLNEGPTTLDDAYALHYAAAYCDSKTTTELLDLGNSDINLRNNRGYTVLHIAAMHKEPAIIVALLTKGAHPSDETLDGRNALQISRRLTRAIDYNSFTETGKESPKDRLCIEILEQAERRDPLLGDASLSLALAGDDLRMKLLYLENRGEYLSGMNSYF